MYVNIAAFATIGVNFYTFIQTFHPVFSAIRTDLFKSMVLSIFVLMFIKTGAQCTSQAQFSHEARFFCSVSYTINYGLNSKGLTRHEMRLMYSLRKFLTVYTRLKCEC
jgi:hypothetical protein